MYDFSQLKNKIEETKDWLKQEYQGIRTGRAAPALLDNIQVESYGTMMPLNQVANVGVEDARTLRVAPYDASQVKDIEKAVTEANLGVGISADSAGVRVTFPELTAERRDTLIKLAKDKLEEGRVSLRGARDDAWSEIQKKEQDGEMSEDEKFTNKEEMEKIIKEANDELDALLEKKEKEISE